MNSSRRGFLRKGSALLANAATGGQVGLLGTLWSSAALPVVTKVAARATVHQSHIAMLLRFAGEFNQSLSSALDCGANHNAKTFVTGLDQCVQRLCFFHLHDDFDKVHWSDILNDANYLQGIHSCSRTDFETVDDVSRAIIEFKDNHFFQNIPLKLLHDNAEALVWEKLLAPYLEKLKGFNWVEYMEGLDSGDGIESVYQLLSGFSDRLPPDIVHELESAYDAFSYGECVSGIQSSPLRQAATFIRFFDEGAGQEKWFIEREKWSWRDYRTHYKVTADFTGDAGRAELLALQEKWMALYKGRLQFEPIEQDQVTGTLSFIFEPHESYEDEFDQMCSLSYLRKNTDFLKVVRERAEEDERVAVTQVSHSSLVPG